MSGNSPQSERSSGRAPAAGGAAGAAAGGAAGEFFPIGPADEADARYAEIHGTTSESGSKPTSSEQGKRKLQADVVQDIIDIIEDVEGDIIEEEMGGGSSGTERGSTSGMKQQGGDRPSGAATFRQPVAGEVEAAEQYYIGEEGGVMELQHEGNEELRTGAVVTGIAAGVDGSEEPAGSEQPLSSDDAGVFFIDAGGEGEGLVIPDEDEESEMDEAALAAFWGAPAPVDRGRANDDDLREELTPDVAAGADEPLEAEVDDYRPILTGGAEESTGDDLTAEADHAPKFEPSSEDQHADAAIAEELGHAIATDITAAANYIPPVEEYQQRRSSTDLVRDGIAAEVTAGILTEEVVGSSSGAEEVADAEEVGAPGAVPATGTHEAEAPPSGSGTCSASDPDPHDLEQISEEKAEALARAAVEFETGSNLEIISQSPSFVQGEEGDLAGTVLADESDSLPRFGLVAADGAGGGEEQVLHQKPPNLPNAVQQDSVPGRVEAAEEDPGVGQAAAADDGQESLEGKTPSPEETGSDSAAPGAPAPPSTSLPSPKPHWVTLPPTMVTPIKSDRSPALPPPEACLPPGFKEALLPPAEDEGPEDHAHFKNGSDEEDEDEEELLFMDDRGGGKGGQQPRLSRPRMTYVPDTGLSGPGAVFEQPVRSKDVAAEMAIAGQQHRRKTMANVGARISHDDRQKAMAGAAKANIAAIKKNRRRFCAPIPIPEEDRALLQVGRLCCWWEEHRALSVGCRDVV